MNNVDEETQQIIRLGEEWLAEVKRNWAVDYDEGNNDSHVMSNTDDAQDLIRDIQRMRVILEEDIQQRNRNI